MTEDEPLFTRQLSRSQLVLVDALVAATYTLVLGAMVTVQAADVDAPSTIPRWVPFAVILAMGAPLAVRRLRPVPVFGIVFVASVLALVLGIVRDGFVGAGFALYMVAVIERRPRREPTLLIAGVAALGLAALVVAGSPVPLEASLGSVVIGVVVLAAAWTIGRAVRERRRFAARSAAQLVERAVSDERLRIARDLHDVVAHGLSLIVIKAATADHVASARPEEARDALRVIETTGRAALVEMRQMLDVLRLEEATAERDALAPVPSLDDLPALAARVAMAGVQVDFELVGLQRVPDGLTLAVYRIVQEGLTNVVKHAAPARSQVTITASDDDVHVEVVDDGQRAGVGPPMTGSSGHGLIGLRERVRVLGGDLKAGPNPTRGYRLVARIPFEPPAIPAAKAR